MQARLEPAFLDGFEGGRRFALWILPHAGTPVRGSLLCVQPFAQEAQLARRVLVGQAMRLASSGWATLVLDPFGTGDSDGAASEATLAVWRSDLLRASRVARERVAGPFVLWGTRVGALLAAELSVALDQIVEAIILWQPTLAGTDLIPLRPDDEAEARDREAPLVDLCGQRWRRDLVDDLRALSMQPAVQGEHSAACPVLILGIESDRAHGAPSPKPLAQLAEAWLQAGFLASLRVVPGVPFWSSPETSLPADAFDETEAFLEGVDAGT